MVSQKDIQGAINTYFAANNALDVDGFVDAFAPNASMYNNPGAPPITGQDAIRQVAQRFMAPYSQMNATQDRVFISGNGAAVVYTAQFTAKNGRTASVQGIDIFEVNDQGKIQVIRYYWDPTPLAAILRDEAQ